MKPRPRERARGDRGALLVGLVAAVAILMILSTVAAQKWADVLRRDNEAEMMFRAQEIVRAIRKFQRDKPGQPLTELKLLMEPGSKRQFFLRKLYKDPLVKDGKWGLLYAAPQGGVYDPAAGPMEDLSGAPPVPGPSGSPSGPGMRPTASPGAMTSGLGQPGEVLGLPIVGVKTLCKEHPFRIYKESEDYSRWLFTVFDLDRQQAGGNPNPNPNPGDPKGVGSQTPPTGGPGKPGLGPGRDKP